MKKLFRSVFLTFYLFIQIGNSFAQDPLIFKRITVDNGLSQNTVMSILQDKRGTIWIGTFDGLCKFNGIEFKIYKNEAGNKSSLSNNQVNKIFEDNKDNIWINTVAGINRYNPDTDSFVRYTSPDSSFKGSVLSMVQDNKGTIWAGSGIGLIKLSVNQTKKYSFLNSNLCNVKIQCLYEDDQQQLWIGTDQTLKIYDLKIKQFVNIPQPLLKEPALSNCVIRTIIQDHNRDYWIGTETAGLFYYDVKAAKCINFNKSNGLLSNTIRTLLEPQASNLWVGTKNGLNIIDITNHHIKSYMHDPDDPNSLSQNSIRTIIKDNEGNIWLGTYNGGVNVVYRQSDNFYHLGIKRGNTAGLSYGIVNTMMQDEDGSFWIGTDDGGLNHVSSNMESNNVYYKDLSKNKELLGNSIKAIIAQPDKNKLWVGTGTGLKIFDKNNHSFVDAGIIENPPLSSPIQNYVFLKDQKGFWIGTNFSGLYYIENQKIIHHYIPTGNPGSINSNIIISLLREGDNLWIGTKTSGLSCLNINTHKIKNYLANTDGNNTLTNNSVLTIFKDLKGRLWIGTDGGGLNYLDIKTGKFYAITEPLGIHNNTIHQILEDNSGRIWLSTNKGLSAITIKQFKVPFNANDLITANYSIEDGLQSNQFTSGVGIKARNGLLVFGGINGVTVFDPDKIRINPVKPPIVLTDFLILNKSVKFSANSPLTKPVDETTEIRLNYNQAFFSIRFAALNYINPEKNQFAYKLEGFPDDEWHYVGNQQMATYTNVDPGTYFFKVKAANNDGIWNNNPRILKITVLPPWWKTWYAYTGYLIIIIALLYLFNSYSKKTERLKAELEFESISHIKDQELAQKKLSFFMNISHEIKTPLTMIMAPIERLINLNQGNNKIQHQLTLMQRNGERLIRLINQLLDIRKLDSGNMFLQTSEEDIVVFLKEIVLAFNTLAKSKNINLVFKSDEDKLPVWFDRDKLEKVMYNLLSNAIKFTADNGTVGLSVKRETNSGKGNVLIIVKDNGCGIPPQDLPRLFKQFFHNGYHHSNAQGTGLGLAFSKELVELHYGIITVDSAAENGAERGFTSFEVRLPLGNGHLNDSEMIATATGSEDIANYHPTEKSVLQQFSLRKAEIIKAEGKGRFYLLIVEDNEDVLNFIKAGFEDDFVIYTAANGVDGWNLAKEHIPDIIISDVMMPKMDGIELCRNLKSGIETSHIPVILLTARTPLIFKIEGLDTGADDYVTKPFTFSILEARVWNLIENRQKMRLRYQKEIMLEPQHIAISDADEVFLNKTLSYIESNIDNVHLSVEQLSAELAMSRGTFTKKIKALTNQTGLEFIRSIRLKRAAQLLSYGQLNVNEVVYMVGFLDVNYFRKCFKEQFGYTPKEQNTIDN